jgi:hypothetical protein
MGIYRGPNIVRDGLVCNFMLMVNLKEEIIPLLAGLLITVPLKLDILEGMNTMEDIVGTLQEKYQ